jgi:hypothetical protein
MKSRNFVAIAMFVQFRGKGGAMKDRRVARGGARNVERDFRAEYELDCQERAAERQAQKAS